MSKLPQRLHTQVIPKTSEADAVWSPIAATDDAKRRRQERDEALRAEGRHEAWAMLLIVLGGGMLMMGLRSPAVAVLGLVLFLYGLVTTARIMRVR